ncbi:unnamed protein product, partial [Polarella glacialis]
MASKYRLRLAACSGISSGRPFESDVGKKILMKYGWKEGEGLGRLSNGRTAPIQAQRRELKEGLGQEKRKSEDQWDNWWGDVFNSVAKNMTITNSKITVETSGEDSSDEEDAKDLVAAPKCLSQGWLLYALNGRIIDNGSHRPCYVRLRQTAPLVPVPSQWQRGQPGCFHRGRSVAKAFDSHVAALASLNFVLAMGKRPGGARRGLAGDAGGRGSSDDEQQLLERLGKLLEDASLSRKLRALEPAVVRALVQLAEQSIVMGIDYSFLGVGWHHPSSRTAYRLARHSSTVAAASRLRAAESRRLLAELLAKVAEGELDAEEVVSESFVREIGLLPMEAPSESVSFGAVCQALAAELLLPLRALNECRMTQTMCGSELPAEELKQVVLALTQAVLRREGGFAEWRYTNPVGREQLRGLSEEQLQLWREPTEMQHSQGLRTHEDEPGELGFFWATKIGGPSHGFDYESQCILPLLANARHKVLLVSDPKLGSGLLIQPAAPTSAEKHFAEVEPRLWLETVNCDFEVSTDSWDCAALRHAALKADSMHVPLSVDGWLKEATHLSRHRASDYLSSEHDWVQRDEEITHAVSRVLYVQRASPSNNLQNSQNSHSSQGPSRGRGILDSALVVVKNTFIDVQDPDLANGSKKTRRSQSWGGAPTSSNTREPAESGRFDTLPPMRPVVPPMPQDFSTSSVASSAGNGSPSSKEGTPGLPSRCPSRLQECVDFPSEDTANYEPSSSSSSRRTPWTGLQSALVPPPSDRGAMPNRSPWQSYNSYEAKSGAGLRGELPWPGLLGTALQPSTCPMYPTPPSTSAHSESPFASEDEACGDTQPCVASVKGDEEPDAERRRSRHGARRRNRARFRPCKSTRQECKGVITLLNKVFESDPAQKVNACQTLAAESPYMR